MQTIRRGDLVQVVAGADRGKQGRVLAIKVAERRVRIEKVRMQKHHLKPGRKGARQGGIVEQEGYVALSNVMLIDPADNKPSRIRIEERDGRRVRVFVLCDLGCAVGAALLGLGVGDTIEWPSKGKTLHLTLIAVAPA